MIICSNKFFSIAPKCKLEYTIKQPIQNATGQPCDTTINEIKLSYYLSESGLIILNWTEAEVENPADKYFKILLYNINEPSNTDFAAAFGDKIQVKPGDELFEITHKDNEACK